MIEITNRDGSLFEWQEYNKIPVVIEGRSPQVAIADPIEVTVPWTVTIPEGYEARVTGVGQTAMNNPGWVGYISVPEWARVIPAGEYGHGKPDGMMKVTIEGQLNAGAGSKVRRGDPVAYLSFHKVEPAIKPNVKRGRPKKVEAA